MKKKIFWNKFWIVLTLLLTVIYLGWRIFRTVPYEKSLISYVFWVLLLAAEMFGLFEMAVHLAGSVSEKFICRRSYSE